MKLQHSYLYFDYSRDALKKKINYEMSTWAGYFKPDFNIGKIIGLEIYFDGNIYFEPVVPNGHGILIEMVNRHSYFLQKNLRIDVRMGNMEWGHHQIPTYILGQPKPVLRHKIELESCYLRLQLLEQNYGLWSTVNSVSGSTVVGKEYRFKPTSRFKRVYYVDPENPMPGANHVLQFAEDPEFLNLIETDIIEFVYSLFNPKSIKVNP